jgi:hypothetical protein
LIRELELARKRLGNSPPLDHDGPAPRHDGPAPLKDGLIAVQAEELRQAYELAQGRDPFLGPKPGNPPPDAMAFILSALERITAGVAENPINTSSIKWDTGSLVDRISMILENRKSLEKELAALKAAHENW